MLVFLLSRFLGFRRIILSAIPIIISSIHGS